MRSREETATVHMRSEVSYEVGKHGVIKETATEHIRSKFTAMGENMVRLRIL